MIPNKKISEHFYLHEFIKSQVASRFGFYEQYNPSQRIIDNIESLVKNVLQPLRYHLNAPIFVHSGYRCYRVNKLIGGANNSQHLYGMAADIECYSKGNKAIYESVLELGLDFDQMINEFNFDWIHISYNPLADKQRKVVLSATRRNGKTIYTFVKQL